MTTDAAVERGLNSQGESDAPIYRAAAALLRARRARGVLVDVGCGIGRFLEYASDLAADYIGVDVVRHPGLSQDAAFHRADLDRDSIPLPAASADIVAALETIEHLENPRAFCRELVRVLKPGGWLVLSTPNQLSVLSILCLIVKGRFVAFQDGSYPVHRTALLASRSRPDCRRMRFVAGRARVLVRRPDSADGRALSADAVGDVSPGAFRQRGARCPQGCVIGHRCGCRPRRR